ncbi:MAG: UDP-N-acetylmuramoyl-L-alanyl-D-glutamate--2,6-diaminopimelate ligase [Clostridiales bacterium]|nr:UDP-N-acetylmuramoyl-L-alanyl-D-glutamate--2,6-diaminopimelate ligase [Clostridiales bacterium]
MTLSKLLNGITVKKSSGPLEIEILDISQDSRKIKHGDLFVCISGTNFDGNDFIYKAIESGAVAIISEKNFDTVDYKTNISFITIENMQTTLPNIAYKFYNFPQKKLKLIGVTGTNGKTTVTHMIRTILKSFKKKTGLIGTIEHLILDTPIKSQNTTPDVLEIAKLFSKMVESNVEYVIMEVSSHALTLGRIDECKFLISVFTNLTQDHLDFHQNMKNYLNAKKKIFEMCKIGIVNSDDESSPEITKNSKCQIINYGFKNECNYFAKNVRLSSKNVKFDLINYDKTLLVNINIPGEFSVYNGLAAISTCSALGFDLNETCKYLSNFQGVKGRIEVVDTGKDFHVIIDYAHTPDGLLNILKTVRQFTVGRIITLFGCGGDRDKTKRTKMGEIAARYSDFCVITSDNPRKEDPRAIIEDILPGIKKMECKYVVIENRREAIFYATSIAKKDDIIILAGKGHETYQILSDKTVEFDERKIVLESLFKKNNTMLTKTNKTNNIRQ